MKKILHKAFVSLTTAMALAAAFMPTIIKADIEPQSTRAMARDFALAPQVLTMRITAYSSSVDETDDTPFTTAAGTTVRDGIVATNALPFGTKIKIPELFGDKIFVVEDRMHQRMKNVVDIWMPTKKAALRFGVANADVLIVHRPEISLK